MERDFEHEFKELKQSEIPDLWDRIEAGLSEKAITAPAAGNLSMVKKKQTWRKWGTLAAACLCAVIVLPALAFLVDSGSSGSGSSDTAMDTSAADDGYQNETAVADAGMSGAAQVAEEAADEQSSVTAGAAEETLESDRADVEGIMEYGKGEIEMEDFNADSSSEIDEDAEEETVSDDFRSELTDGQILEGVILQVTTVENIGETVRYQINVLQPDADGILESGMQIEIVCNSDMEYSFPRALEEEAMLKNGESYEVTLCYKGTEFVVVKAEKVE